MRLPVLLAVALVLLALGASMIDIDAMRSWMGSRDARSISSDERIQTYIRRDERGRPVCRRGVAGNDRDRVVEIGHNCP